MLCKRHFWDPPLTFSNFFSSSLHPKILHLGAPPAHCNSLPVPFWSRCWYLNPQFSKLSTLDSTVRNQKSTFVLAQLLIFWPFLIVLALPSASSRFLSPDGSYLRWLLSSLYLLEKSRTPSALVSIAWSTRVNK